MIAGRGCVSNCRTVGVAVWYNNPMPGGLLRNNTAISVVETVNVIQCYSGATSSAEMTIIPPAANNELMFSEVEAGLLQMTGQTAIGGVATGVYTCWYNSSGVVVEESFAVYPRSRESNTS